MDGSPGHMDLPIVLRGSFITPHNDAATASLGVARSDVYKLPWSERAGQ
jgi:hypothetical protein